MKFKRIYCFGRENGKVNESDFVVGYIADNGKTIDVKFLFGNESFRNYEVDGKFYSTLKEAKAACNI